jgi:hypothetical protein
MMEPASRAFIFNYKSSLVDLFIYLFQGWVIMAHSQVRQLNGYLRLLHHLFQPPVVPFHHYESDNVHTQPDLTTLIV